MEEEKRNNRKIVFGILEFLNEEMNKAATDGAKESLEVAMQCLETTFEINLNDSQYRPEKSLRELAKQDTPDLPEPQSSSSSSRELFCVHTGPEYTKTPEASKESKEKADELKNLGNDAMKILNITEGLDCYNKAIALDGNNAVYFCNRAAAYLKLERYEEALRDCQIAIQVQPTYGKAYGRMGVVFSSQKNHVDASVCYKKALELEPDNESYKNNLKVSQHLMLQNVTAAQAQAAASPNFQSFFSNPGFMNMALQMLQNPSMQQMIQNLMQSINNGSPPEAAGTNGAIGSTGTELSSDMLNSLMEMGRTMAQQQQAENSNQTSPGQSTDHMGSGDAYQPKT